MSGPEPCGTVLCPTQWPCGAGLGVGCSVPVRVLAGEAALRDLVGVEE